MRILWCTINRKLRVASHIFTSLPSELSKLVEVDIITRNLNMLAGKYNKNIMKGRIISEPLLNINIANTYDFIIVDAMFAYTTEYWENITAKKVILIEDQHKSTTLWYINEAKRHNFDIYLLRYKTTSLQEHQWLQYEQTIWIPHSINPQLHKDYELPKTRECIIVGATHKDYYPIRDKAVNELQDQSYFEIIPRPDETTNTNTKRWPIGKDYTKLLNETKIVITCTSILEYPVIKFFEIAGCNSVVCSNHTSELGELGFIPNENMIEITINDDLSEVIPTWLQSDKLQDVSKAGYDLIHSKHTSQIRAKELLSELERNI